jgi:hypothetical protein
LTGPLSFEIDCTPSDAIITINGKENNNVGLVPNTTLVYKAEKTGYWYKEKEVTVTEDHVEPVVLQYPTDA